LTLISEAQEIEMGRRAEPQVLASFGEYPDEEWQTYVNDLGQELAAASERPQLPWAFHVLDDPLVNAFAYPGGYIYVTRGIMSYLASEAELATVIGHEIGHVTARHGADQMTKAQLTQAGLMLGSALGPEWARGLSDYAQIGAGLLFLKFGRDDERQADELGLRYLLSAGYDARPSAGVFDMLDRVGGAEGGSRTPAWLATHPAPENRKEDMDAAVAALNRDFAGSKVGRQEYFAHIDGIIFGSDPRDGYFEDQRFYHPRMAFRFEFPVDWKTSNSRESVVGASPAQDAIISITHATSSSPDRALETFIGQEGIAGGSVWRDEVNGLQVAARNFSATSRQGAVRGVVVFVRQGETVLRVMGYSLDSAWSSNRDAIENALASFDQLTDPDALGVQPARLRIVDARSNATLGEFARQTDATVSVDRLALLNRLDPSDRLVQGSAYKTVNGGRMP
jgi:predicted Zn-dependent protease